MHQQFLSARNAVLLALLMALAWLLILLSILLPAVEHGPQQVHVAPILMPQ
ncbi:hypothetical protein LT85_1986 [Collimonas arenae]|uniref:Uncharacterized protein n=1 Tax=Collimonas arenae TaxID=279058 RepID=A0A0A1FBT8_9BURK|nr:hypothetical protein [Collimonas arenae]AIY41144.1 hypothetical protein LT85_1986 [Collimonas arenae]